MPSQLHEGLISLFRHQPALAPQLLAHALQADVPEYTEARIDSADLTEIQPTEYRADLVIQLRRDDSVLGIVVEVQLGRDDDKGFVWPVYIATLRNRIRCPVCLLVIAPDAEVANWAGQPILLGGDSRVVPLVLNATNIPQIVSVKRRERIPSSLYCQPLRMSTKVSSRAGITARERRRVLWKDEPKWLSQCSPSASVACRK